MKTSSFKPGDWVIYDPKVGSVVADKRAVPNRIYRVHSIITPTLDLPWAFIADDHDLLSSAWLRDLQPMDLNAGESTMDISDYLNLGLEQLRIEYRVLRMRALNIRGETDLWNPAFNLVAWSELLSMKVPKTPQNWVLAAARVLETWRIEREVEKDWTEGLERSDIWDVWREGL